MRKILLFLLPIFISTSCDYVESFTDLECPVIVIAEGDNVVILKSGTNSKTKTLYGTYESEAICKSYNVGDTVLNCTK